MRNPLLDGPMSVANAIQKFSGSHMGRNPTLQEFRDKCLVSGNTNTEIDRYVDEAVGIGIISYDRDADMLSIGDWRHGPGNFPPKLNDVKEGTER